MGERSGAPLGLSCIKRHFGTSGCGSITASLISQLTVTHPIAKCYRQFPGIEQPEGYGKTVRSK
jgi:hypothetical protein